MKEKVWMHKKTGQLYEHFVGILGGVIAWEDLTSPKWKDRRITRDTPLQFDDEYNVDDFEDLGEL